MLLLHLYYTGNDQFQIVYSERLHPQSFKADVLALADFAAREHAYERNIKYVASDYTPEVN